MHALAPSTAARVALLASWVLGGCLAEGLPPNGTYQTTSPTCAVDVPMRRLTPAQYANAVTEIFGGRVRASARFPTQTGRSQTGFSTEPGINSVDRLAAEQIMLAAEDVAVQIPEVIAADARCRRGIDARCIEAFIATTTTRAYRRPPTEEEQATLQRVFDSARADEASAAEAAAVVVAVILQSPQFLYALEVGTSDEASRRLTPYEIATRLSLLLWDGVPDDALLAAAREGALATPEGIVAEARRMFDDPRAKRMSRRFFREWMHVEELTGASRDPARYPWFDAAFAASVGTAFDTYVHAAFTEAWTLEELLTSNRTPVDGALAEHFGVSAPTEPWAWVEVAPSRGVGVMTQPAVMASLAHYDESSYVRRGHFVLSGLLCRSFGDPPANATGEFASIKTWLRPGASRRELSRAVQGKSACAACHYALDPPGLAFENYDATGRWREADRYGNHIDPSGRIDQMHIEFADAREMMTALAQRYQAKACFERQVFRYFAARLDGPDDVCVFDQVRARAGEDASIADTVMSLIASDGFWNRRVR